MFDIPGFDAIVCERLTLTLLHFLWQGAAIGLVAAFLSAVLQGASSQLRYLIHLTALMAMCGSLLVTLCVVNVSEPAVHASKVESNHSGNLAGNDGRKSSNGIPLVVSDANPASLAPNSSFESIDRRSLTQSNITPPTDSRTSSEVAASEYKRYLSKLAPYVTATYLAGVALLLTRLLRSAWYTRRLGRSASEVSNEDLLLRMKTQAERLGLRFLPAVGWCQHVSVPMVIGVFRPLVLLPAYASTGLTIDQLQAVIAHELAHIRRYDLLVNILQRVVESLLFFHPAVWWVSRQMANEREQACDELVLKVGTGRAQYADALVKMAELSIQYGQPPIAALASTGSSTTAFKRRILKVLEVDTSPRIRPGRIAAVVSSMAVLLALATLFAVGGTLASGTLADRDARDLPEKTSIEGTDADDELLPAAKNADAANDDPTAQPPGPKMTFPPRVELIGLTYDRANKQPWQPNGEPMPVPDWVTQLPKLVAVDLGLPSPLFLFEIHGLRGHPSIQYQHKTAAITGDTELPKGRAYRQAILFEDLKNNTNKPNWSEAPTMFLSDEAWGPWRKINSDGRFTDPVDENGFYRNAYSEVASMGIRPLKANTKTAVDDTAASGLILKYPAKFAQLYAIEIEAIPAASDRQPVLLQPRFLDEQPTDDKKILEVEWPVDSNSLDHLRMRVRPFRHKYVFENVNYAASQNAKNYTQFKTVYTKLDHDLPKPAVAKAPPLLDVSVIDAQTNQPVTGGKVTVRWSFDRHALTIVGKPVRKVFDLKEEFDLTEQGTFPIRIPGGMEGAKLQVQASIRHPDYVINQSFGSWPFGIEMAADPTLAKKKLFNGGVIKLTRGFEIRGLVTDSLNQPVTDVRVYAATQLPEYLNMPPHAVTDNQGRYKFRVSGYDGFRLMFVPASLNKSTAGKGKPTDTVQSNYIAQSITIRKEYGNQPSVKLQSGMRIVGVVRDAAGKPLPNVVVQGNGSDSVYMGFPEILSRVVTDAMGRYELPAQKLPVDVRVSRFNTLGGWSEPASMPVDVYLPELVTDRWGKLRQGEENVFEVDFVPVRTVTLRARAYNAKGQPDTEADIELIGRIPFPDANPAQPLPHWRRTFTAVPDKPGLFELTAPKGLLDARIDLTNEGLLQPVVGTWTRAVRENEKSDAPNTRAAWPVLDQADDTIMVGQPAPGFSTLNSGAPGETLVASGMSAAIPKR